MRIDALTVCVHCPDYLAWTLPHNRPQLDRLLVVTSPDDEATQRLCRHWHVETLVTEAFTANGQRFNKGAGVEEGLRKLDFQGWCLHLDADIALPPRFRNLLNVRSLDEQCLYGVDRYMVPSTQAWVEYISAPEPQHEMGRARTNLFPLGYRVLRTKGDPGYIPLGFFQLFHRASAHIQEPLYPIQHDTAAASDLEFSCRWPAIRRQLLPDIVVYHLDSEEGERKGGANWLGRTTPTFGFMPQPKVKL